MYCPNCKNSNKKGKEYCEICGYKLVLNHPERDEAGENTHKKTKNLLTYFIAGDVVLFVCLVVMVILLVNRQNVNNEKLEYEVIQQYCLQFAKDYVVVSTTEDNKSLISVTAPDFSSIVVKLSEEGKQITEKELKRIVSENASETKEYTFSVDNTEDREEVEHVFLEQISYELMLDAVRNTEYVESGSGDS